MEVKDVYQDTEGKWHIDYDSDHLMGLAFRVYWGQFLLSIFVGIPLIVLASLVSAKSLDEEKNIDSNLNSSVLQESFCNYPAN